MNGFYGRILDVDLDARQFSIETVADNILKTCLGGKGLGSHILYEKNSAGVDPLDGKNLLINQVGAFPTRYWQQGRYEKWEQIGADALHSRCDVQPRARLKCFIACGRLTTVRDGRHAWLQIEGPEYETICVALMLDMCG
jgi:aldehyde:ferredoxin oxidoreductase